MPIDEKYLPDQLFSTVWKVVLMHIEICKYKKRTTGHKLDDTIGELSSTGNENNIRHLECILLRSLPSVPSIAVDQQHKPFPFWFSDALVMRFCQGVKKKRTKNRQW